MNAGINRRLRRLEGTQPPSDDTLVVVLNWPGRADPPPEEIARASKVIRLRFVSTGAGHARH